MTDTSSTWLAFTYKGEEIEVLVEFEISGDEEDGYGLSLDILKNDTDYTDEELHEYIFDDDKLFDVMLNRLGEKAIEYENGYEDYLIEQAERDYK